MERVLVLIPARDEEKNIVSVIEDIRDHMPRTDIVVVDDGSEDSTGDRARSEGVHVLSHPYNMGYGTALQTGYKFALENDYEFVIQMDADGQHDARYLPSLLSKLRSGSCDIVIGSRFLDGNGAGYRVPLSKRIGMILFSAVASVIVRQRVTDPTSGLQALDRRALAYCTSDAYPFDFADADVLVMLYLAGLRIDEIPVTMRASKNGRSRYLSMYSIVTPFYYVFRMGLSIGMSLLRGRRTAAEV
jgi:glycosyltransferase involved in cell wall biosynthesis